MEYDSAANAENESQMKTLQFLIDNICADFTLDSLLGLVKACLVNGPATISDISRAIRQKDLSLDARCAEGLAEGAVQAMCDSGEVEVSGALVYATGSTASPK